MPASPTRSRAGSLVLRRALLLVAAVAVGVWAGASRAAAQTEGQGSVAGSGLTYRGQTGFAALAARTVVPARMAGLPTAAVAARTLDGPGWPIQAVDTTRGVLVTQWISFSVNGLRTTPPCWIDVRLGVRPLKEDSTNVELIAQLLLQGRFNTDPAMRLARLAVDGFRADLLARAQSGADAGRLADLLNYNRATPAEFNFCGVQKHN